MLLQLMLVGALALSGSLASDNANASDATTALDNTTARITSAKVNSGRLEVSGSTYGTGTAWIGVTIRRDGTTFDRGDVYEVEGRFTEQWDLSVYPGKGTWEVAVWKTRVDNCGCSYCRKNGFHLEDNLARSSGKFSNG